MSPIISKTLKASDNHLVHYDLYAQDHGQVIIIAPGFFNSKDALLLKELGKSLNNAYDAMILDFRGHGKSGGLFYWTSKEYLDLLSVLEYAQEHYDQVGLIGFSLGAATSLIAASKSDIVDSIVAVSAPAEFEKIEYHFWELNLDLDIRYSLFSEGRIGKGVKPGPFWLPKEKPRDVVKSLNRPVFYLHGTEDWLIKPWHSELLYQKTASKIKKLEIVQGMPHAEYIMKTHRDIFVRKIKNWFKETL